MKIGENIRYLLEAEQQVYWIRAKVIDLHLDMVKVQYFDHLLNEQIQKWCDRKSVKEMHSYEELV